MVNGTVWVVDSDEEARAAILDWARRQSDQLKERLLRAAEVLDLECHPEAAAILRASTHGSAEP